MSATKSKTARKPAAKAKAPAKRSKPEPVAVEIRGSERRTLQAHAIQELINGGGLTIAQMTQRLAKTHAELVIDETRVKDHVMFEVDKRKRASMDKRGVVTLIGKAPRWRSKVVA
jgi:hypothetical protein